VAGTLAR
jgi:SHAQKYF class myb-like DNA-binding protein